MAVKKNATRSREFSDSIIDTIRESLIALDQDFRMFFVSRSFMSTASLYSNQMRSGSSGKERI